MIFTLVTDIASGCLIAAFGAATVSLLCAVFGSHQRYSASARLSNISAFVGLACFLVILLSLRLVAGGYVRGAPGIE